MPQSPPAQPIARRRDPERTRADILAIATSEFAANGFDGARVDEIAALTRTTKRMIYYYFGSKEGLYLEVIERAYQVIRELERSLDVTGLDPVDALRRLAETTFDHHTTHHDFVRLVATENIQRAAHLSRSTAISDLNRTAIATLSRVIDRGVREGVFRADVDPLDVHAAISSYAFFHVANRYTFRAIFHRDLLDPERTAHNRQIAGDLVVGLMTAPAADGWRGET